MGWDGKFCLFCLVVSSGNGSAFGDEDLAFHQNYFTQGSNSGQGHGHSAAVSVSVSSQ